MRNLFGKYLKKKRNKKVKENIFKKIIRRFNNFIERMSKLVWRF